MKIRWEWKAFPDFKPIELYRVLQHRGQIFAVEQNEAYLDADDKDIDAWHILGWNEDNLLVAYARVIPPKESDNKIISFGRVSIRIEFRGQKIATLLINEILSYIEKTECKDMTIQISAQRHLLEFYSRFGFIAQGDEYFAGRIPHMKMIRESMVKKPIYNLKESESLLFLKDNEQSKAQADSLRINNTQNMTPGLSHTVTSTS